MCNDKSTLRRVASKYRITANKEVEEVSMAWRRSLTSSNPFCFRPLFSPRFLYLPISIDVSKNKDETPGKVASIHLYINGKRN